MKEIHPSLWMQNHQAAHKFFVSESGVLVPSSKEDLVFEQLAIDFIN